MKTFSISAALCAVLILGAAGCSSAKLQIDSEPSGAQVYVDDVAMGATPLKIDYTKLPYDNVLNVRVDKANYGTLTTYVEGPRQANLGQKVIVRIPKSPDETSIVNHDVDQILAANKLAMARRFGEAMDIADQLIADHPDLVAAHVLRGSICFFAKNYSEARSSYMNVLRLDASNSEATKMLKYMDDHKLSGASDRAVSSESSPAIDPATNGGTQ